MEVIIIKSFKFKPPRKIMLQKFKAQNTAGYHCMYVMNKLN